MSLSYCNDLEEKLFVVCCLCVEERKMRILRDFLKLITYLGKCGGDSELEW